MYCIDALPAALRAAGLLHLGLLAAGITMPGVIGLPAHLSALPRIIRRLVWLYYTCIGFCVVGFGTLSFFLADALASGAPLARAVCVLLCGFWTIRLGAALLVLDTRPYLTRRLLRLGNAALNVVFILLPAVYAWAALRGGAP